VTPPANRNRISGLVATLVVLVALTGGTEVAAAGPSPPAPSPDATHPVAIGQAGDAVAHAPAQGAQSMLAPSGTATTQSSSSLQREVFGFALASSLNDPTVGYPSWDFSLLSTVAFFGLHINDDGTIASDPGLTVWNSSQLTGLISAARATNTKVVLTIVKQDFAAGTPHMCATLANRATVVSQTVAQVSAKGVDGVNIDFEGLNGTCPNGETARSMMTELAHQMRVALPGLYISVDTYASSASDSLGFFDIPGLNAYVDSFFVMAYDLEYSNYSRPPLSCSSFCLGPTAPLAGYYYNDTTSAVQYSAAVPASKVILGVPYYGRKSCVSSVTPNATPTGTVTADTYLNASTESGSSEVQLGSYATHRDSNDPAGQERWDTWYNTTLKCTRELYWDDTVSLGLKYDLVNKDALRGVGIWNLNYGGGAAELWSALEGHFERCTSVTDSAAPSSPQGSGSGITFTAGALGCAHPLYQFWILAPGKSWQVVQPYSSVATFNWNTTGVAAGNYLYTVWARDASSSASYDAYFPGTNYTLTTQPCTSVTDSPSPGSPQLSGTPITFTAGASGCLHPLYQFWLLAPGHSWQIVQPYSTTATFNWNTTGLPAGSYMYTVWARDSGSSASYDTYLPGTNYSLTTTQCTSVTDSPAPASPQLSGTPVTFTATASGCPHPLYQFWILAPGHSWQIVQPYSTATTFNWTTTGLPPGNYMYTVWARDSSSAASYDAYSTGTIYTLTSQPCASVTASAAPSSPQASGTPVTFTAVASGCPHPLYQFWILAPGHSWQVVQPYSSTATFNWTTTGLPPGSYLYTVWVRDSSSTGASCGNLGCEDTYSPGAGYTLN
jgi:spore germination protein YaaH